MFYDYTNSGGSKIIISGKPPILQYTGTVVYFTWLWLKVLRERRHFFCFMTLFASLAAALAFKCPLTTLNCQDLLKYCFPHCFRVTKITFNSTCKCATVLVLICSFMSSRRAACYSSAKEFANDVWLGLQGEINRCFFYSFVITLLVHWLTTACDK